MPPIPLPGREGQGVGRLPHRRFGVAQAGRPTPNPSLPGRGARRRRASVTNRATTPAKAGAQLGDDAN
ncbi:MAG: hypothetical protein EOP66_16455 [Sphingomonas sp.]|nr:MAG: hypothetical protein EOP66_16455 [Sphingomonas sp.]